MNYGKLLVVEDENKIAELVSRVASEAGFVTRIVGATESIIGTFDEFRPDVIILDILMPEMDGFEVLQFLSKRESTARVIILSGEGFYRVMAERMAGGLNLNITANVPKPFRITELREMLDNIGRSMVTVAA